MGFDDGRIILDREDETYYTGQFVRGRLELNLSKVKSFRGIYVDFKGFCKVHWTSSHSRRENDRTVHYTVVHESYEEYINVTTYLVGSKSGEHQLFPGNHVFPFEFLIPPHCPSSLEASDGHVRYEVKATVDRAFKLDQHKTARFRVLAPIDLNANPYCKEPIGMEFYQSYCCWCMSAGKSEVTVVVPAGGACPGQVLPVQLACKNSSTVDIQSITFQIKEKKVFHAHSEPDTRSYNDTILEVKKGPIPGHTERNWIVELEIPDMNVLNMMGCRFIEVDYMFKVKIKTPSCHKNGEETRPFIIGAIPLRDLNNQPIAPTESTPVSHGFAPAPYPIMDQSIAEKTPYPNVQPSPYPAPVFGINPPQNSPYPVPPYPNANPPYPNPIHPPFPSSNIGNAPYPTSQETSPYPAPAVPSNAPYPTSSPYPPAASPYPPATSPYPPATSPYPPATSPYPPAASPYPPATSPYPPATSPYPPATSPYPPTTSAYPPTTVPYENGPKPTSTTLLKTGNLGFIEQGKHNKDGAAMPFLPPSAGVPYPTSPFASASAPAPSTPDDAAKKLFDDIPTHSSPFNPQYNDK